MKKIYIVLICISLSLLIGLGVAAALVHIDKTEPKQNAEEPLTLIDALFKSACEAGYEGTLDEFIASLSENLKGKDGRDGTDGAPGRDGVDGAPGAPGRDGVDGAPGRDGADGVGISSIEKTASVGDIDIYTITFTNGLTTTFQIRNGGQGLLGGSSEIDFVGGKWYINKAAFVQEGNSLNGLLELNIANVSGFGKVTYSVYREGATINGTTYYDYIKKDVELTENSNIIPLVAGYHGNYQIDIKYYNHSDDEAPLYVYNRNGINFKADSYNFLYSNSTLPVLYGAMDLVTMDHTDPTYVAIHRNATFDWYQLPANTYAMPNTTFETKSTNLALFDDHGNQKTSIYGGWKNGSWGAVYNGGTVTNALKHMKKWIADLYAMDNDATFTFYTDDTVANVVLWWSYGNNLDEKNFEIVMYTEGSSTVNRIRQHNYTTYAQWRSVRAEYLDYLDDLRNGTDITSIWKTKYAFVMNADENVRHIVNSKEAILNTLAQNDAEYAAYRAFMGSNLEQVSISEGLAKVSAANKIEDLEFLLRTRWIDNTGAIGSANDYFSNGNGKKNLMIIGTSVSGENNSYGAGTGTTLMTFMPYLLQTYGEEYNIFYKGHPSYPIQAFSDGRAEYFAQNNIIVLPNAVPAETYMYLYQDVYIGGYYSSTMLSSKVGQTLFFFGKEQTIKSIAALAPFYDESDPEYLGIFENTVYINIDNIN